MKFDKSTLLPYSIGGLLYTPANKEGIAEKIEKGSISNLTSIAFCLEDAIADTSLHDAELTLKTTLSKLRQMKGNGVEIPLVFIRVRNPDHIIRLHDLLCYGKVDEVVTGYLLPKFDMSNAEEYLGNIEYINRGSEHTIYCMPILESAAIAHAAGRMTELLKIKFLLDRCPHVLNIRVGGNDLCNLYGIRVPVSNTIYDVGVTNNIMSDIMSVFGAEYVISAPVWNYFGDSGDEWKRGLEREMAADRVNGFIGKTAIHPSQLPVIAECMKVTREDYNDAIKILNWDIEELGVQKSAAGNRMNEVKCHFNWARRTAMLGQAYGIREV